MANSYWRSGKGSAQRGKIEWPSFGQVVTQVGLAVITVGVWSGLFWGFLNLARGNVQAVAVEPTPAPTAVVEVEPTVTSTPVPSDTPMPTPTDTPEPPTETPTLSSVDAEESSDDSETTESATPLPTETPTEIPTETPTPEPTFTPTVPPTEEIIEEVVDAEAGAVSFANDVYPIFEHRCVKCHGGEDSDGEQRIEEGYNMLTYEDIMLGSWNGPVIEPSDVEASYLIEQIVSGDMPKREPRLLPKEIRVISEWVAAGAPNN